MIAFIINFFIFFLLCTDAWAIGTIIAGSAVLGLSGIAASIAAFAINMVVSTVISKLFAPSPPSLSNQQPEPNPGSRAQTPPAGDNKLPVIYGHAWTGGIITDLSITEDNQTLYYVFALSEVTNTETGGTPDEITFGDVYFGGKKCVFDGPEKYFLNGIASYACFIAYFHSYFHLHEVFFVYLVCTMFYV
jgi:hypothetical protein